MKTLTIQTDTVELNCICSALDESATALRHVADRAPFEPQSVLHYSTATAYDWIRARLSALSANAVQS